MTKSGLPIPKGFAVTAQAYQEFIEKTGIKNKILKEIKNINIDDNEELKKISKRIQDIIKDTSIPKNIKESIIKAYNKLGIDEETKASDILKENHNELVAVRSSATAEDLPDYSFAGQQETFLNISGEENILEAVKKCWSSLFTSRAIYYREKNDFPHDKVYISAIIQRMVQSEKSGVMFTINPSTNDKDEIIIEGAFGLGEAVVGGEVNPDLYKVEKENLDIKDKEKKNQDFKIVKDTDKNKNVKKELTEKEKELQVLNDKEIKEIAQLGKKIEEHYSKPQDIEWAIEDGETYIVQSRAVTTYKEDSNDEEERDNKERDIILTGESASSGIVSGEVKIVNDIENDLGKIKEGDIMVTEMTNPDSVPAMQKASGIITEEGGMTSHAAIVSREMETPCIVGTENATQKLEDKQKVTVDAAEGKVYKGKNIEEKTEEKTSFSENISTDTNIKLILDLPEQAKEASKTKNDGVGLVRLEMMISEGGKHPAEYIREDKDEEYTQVLINGIRDIVKEFSEEPVWIRNSDMRSDEYRELEGGEKEPKESNPMMGWHAIRRLLDEPRILEAEFKAVKKLHEEGYDNIGIMLPFINNIDEIKEAKEYLRKVGLEPQEDIEFGVMIETPAACKIINEICEEGVDFVSFGTNDLTQLTLGVDRNNEKIQDRFNELHPGLLRELEEVIEKCNEKNVKTSICGHSGSKPEMAKFLVKKGIDSISVTKNKFNEIKSKVSEIEKEING